MKPHFLFTFFILSSLSYAQVLPSLEELKERESDYEKTIAQEKLSREKYQKFLKEEEEELAEKNRELRAVLQKEAGRSEGKKQTLSEIEKALDGLPLWQKAHSARKSFYKCLGEGVQRDGHIQVESCRALHSPKLNQEEEKRLTLWNEKIGKSEREIEIQVASLKELLESVKRRVQSSKSSLSSIEFRIKSAENDLKRNRGLQQEARLVNSNHDKINCYDTMSEINLEEKKPYPGATFKGPFYGVPRDNQDGLGTCFANTARNLLLGAGDGKIDASFLDLALLYKNGVKEVSKDGLNGGHSCDVINFVKKKGYCPQKFAPLESGKSNPPFESLLGKGNNIEAHAVTMFLLKHFIGGLENLEDKSSPLDESVLKKGKEIIDTLKNNPRIKLPLPVARFEVPPQWKLQDAFRSLDRTGIKEEDFLAEHDRAYKNFYPLYLRAVIERKKPTEIFDLYQKTMDPFLNKYQLKKKLPDFRQAYLADVKAEFESKEFELSLKESMEFLASLAGKKASDKDFIDYCSGQFNDGLRFLEKLQPLVVKLQMDKVDPGLLVDKNGRFLPSEDMMQLAVAPGCVNKENRQTIPYEIECNDGASTVGAIKGSGKSYEEKLRMMRERVVLSLLQGYPLGNSHPTGPDSRHINTIVGIRYNKSTERCEYRIRESQTGTSNWHPETDIFDKIDALTEVRKIQ